MPDKAWSSRTQADFVQIRGHNALPDLITALLQRSPNHGAWRRRHVANLDPHVIGLSDSAASERAHSRTETPSSDKNCLERLQLPESARGVPWHQVCARLQVVMLKLRSLQASRF